MYKIYSPVQNGKLLTSQRRETNQLQNLNKTLKKQPTQ